MTGCKFPSNLVEFLDMDVNLQDELKKIEGDFQRDEVFEI
jgi:hypothetical protein